MAGFRYADHTDSVAEKLKLLQAAHAAGNYDLAMSLSDSIKDTVSLERDEHRKPAPPQLRAEVFAPVADLPQPLAKWAHPWLYYKPVTLFETVGIARSGEPVDLSVSVRADQAADLEREVRVARLETRSGTLSEVPCQVYAVARVGGERRCRLVFLADVPSHGQAVYLVFYGNAYAERPHYASDLQVSGDGYALDISNAHYVAHLSAQTGQLERLSYKREHGLELFAGGKGHGEPPDIDWGHDYVDEGGFQKLRMRNWARCRNYEVVKGPLCVSVRRWGFPASPLDPVFAPSRIHMDVTYTFYAGLPYFFKQSRFDVIKDVQIEAMRDDEWVLSGYSFTDTVWIDRQGKLHEGEASVEHAKNLWGVGFFHRQSRDAFIALRLDHSAEKFAALDHGGAPTLHYAGHGQLWSRYPANHAELKAGASVRQRNAYLVSPYPKANAQGEIQSVWHRLRSPLEVHSDQLGRLAAAHPVGALARRGESAETAPLKPTIWKALALVRDEQFYTFDANVVDMGYVYDVAVEHGVARVLVTMPQRGRPVYDFLVTQGGGRVEEGIRERLLKIDGVREVVVDFTWDPPWTVHRLSDVARSSLGLRVRVWAGGPPLRASVAQTGSVASRRRGDRVAGDAESFFYLLDN